MIYVEWHELLYCPIHIVRRRIALYARAISSKGVPLENIFAFPDGAKFETCRITANARLVGENGRRLNLQKTIYSGHKRRHCLNYQGLTAPDGLCIHFWGPIAGSCHDTTMLRESRLLDYFDSNNNIFDSKILYYRPFVFLIFN